MTGASSWSIRLAMVLLRREEFGAGFKGGGSKSFRGRFRVSCFLAHTCVCIVQLTIDSSGEVITDWSTLRLSGSLVQLEARVLFIAVGEAADYCLTKKKYQGAGVREFELAIEVGCWLGFSV